MRRWVVVSQQIHSVVKIWFLLFWWKVASGNGFPDTFAKSFNMASLWGRFLSYPIQPFFDDLCPCIRITAARNRRWSQVRQRIQCCIIKVCCCEASQYSLFKNRFDDFGKKFALWNRQGSPVLESLALE